LKKTTSHKCEEVIEVAEKEPKEDGYEEMKKFPPFRVWDMPEQVADDLKAFAREYAGNKVWLAIKLLLEKHKQFVTLNVRVSNLEQRISALEEFRKEATEPKSEEPEPPLTFRGRIGGKKNG
jgi:hypothetical protein